MFTINKDTQINIRIPSQQKETVREFGYTFAKIWELGYNKMMEDLDEKLPEKAEYYQKMYRQCIDKMEKRRANVNTMYIQLDALFDEWWSKQPRDLQKPSKRDLGALKIQLEKKEINTFTPEQVIDYWRKKDGD